MNIRFIKTPEKRMIVEELNHMFGIEELPYLLIETGKEKLRAYSGSLSKEEIAKVGEFANIELIGLYFIRKEDKPRLSIDATLLLKDQISKSIVEISDEQAREWIRGKDIEIDSSSGVCVIKNGDDFLGCGKSNGKVIFNHVPKDRRVKK